MTVTKDHLPDKIVTARTVVRRAKPEDLKQIEAWPSYPPQYEGFNMTEDAAALSRKLVWWRRIDHADRCHYSVVLPQTGEVIGVHAFVGVDWRRGVVGNMGVRIRPDLCDQGYGTETLRALLTAALRSGMRTIRLDVAATNERAITCYEKCGMRVVGEFWREHRGGPIDPSDPEWPFDMRHFRRQKEKWTVRFYWMEIDAACLEAPPR